MQSSKLYEDYGHYKDSTGYFLSWVLENVKMKAKYTLDQNGKRVLERTFLDKAIKDIVKRKTKVQNNVLNELQHAIRLRQKVTAQYLAREGDESSEATERHQFFTNWLMQKQAAIVRLPLRHDSNPSRSRLRNDIRSIPLTNSFLALSLIDDAAQPSASISSKSPEEQGPPTEATVEDDDLFKVAIIRAYSDMMNTMICLCILWFERVQNPKTHIIASWLARGALRTALTLWSRMLTQASSEEEVVRMIIANSAWQGVSEDVRVSQAYLESCLVWQDKDGKDALIK